MKKESILLFLILLFLISCTSEEMTEPTIERTAQNIDEMTRNENQTANPTTKEIAFETITQDIFCGYDEYPMDFVIRDEKDIEKMLDLIINSIIREGHQPSINRSKIRNGLVNKLKKDYMIIFLNQGSSIKCCVNITNVYKTDKGIEVFIENPEYARGQSDLFPNPCHMIRLPLFEEDVIFHHKIKADKSGLFLYAYKIQNRTYNINGTMVEYQTYEDCNFNSTCDFPQLEEDDKISYECETTVNCSYYD